MMEQKYLKVMFNTTSGASFDVQYKIDEINIANNWNPSSLDAEIIDYRKSFSKFGS